MIFGFNKRIAPVILGLIVLLLCMKAGVFLSTFII